MFGLVWLRFGLAKFDLAMVGSQINGDGHTDAACKISAQLDLIWLSCQRRLSLRWPYNPTT